MLRFLALSAGRAVAKEELPGAVRYRIDSWSRPPHGRCGYFLLEPLTVLWHCIMMQ